jgi:hypothetical protein
MINLDLPVESKLTKSKKQLLHQPEGPGSLWNVTTALKRHITRRVSDPGVRPSPGISYEQRRSSLSLAVLAVSHLLSLVYSSSNSVKHRRELRPRRLSDPNAPKGRPRNVSLTSADTVCRPTEIADPVYCSQRTSLRACASAEPPSCLLLFPCRF